MRRRLRPQLTLPAVSLLLLGICAPLLAQQQVRITEFMASNTSGIEDDFAQKSDWIEITNTGTTAVNLLGWHLTDDAADLAKWTFPSLSLATGQRILVWASNRDRRDPAKPLHTNFNLRATGEYLGLIRPDNSVEHDFGAQFPPQASNVSYGIFSGTVETLLISPSSGSTAGSAVKYKVPTDDSAMSAWFLTGASETGWTNAHNGLGYDNNAAGVDYNPLLASDGNIGSQMFNLRTSFYVRIHFNVANTAIVSQLKLRLKYDDGYAAYLNGVYVNRDSVNSALNPPYSYSVTGVNRSDALAVVNTEQNVSTGLLVPGDNVLALHGFNQATSSSDLLLLAELAATVPSPPGNGYFTTPTPNAANSGGTLNPGPLITDVPETLPQPAANSAGSTLVTTSATANNGTQGQGGWSYGYQIGAGTYNAATSFTQFPGGAGQGAWNGTTQTWNGSAWVLNNAGAAPWTQISPSSLHPNGVNNGTQNNTIVRWTSTFAGAAVIKGNFHCPAPCGDGTFGAIYKNGTALFSGVSFQAAQSYQLSTTLAVGDKIDFVITPNVTDDYCDTTNYLMEIYQGTNNATINLPITASVAPSLNPVAAVNLKWRIMFGAETTQPMLDNGLNGDTLAGDGIYFARITTNQLANGEMIRWRVEATDTLGAVGKAPRFYDPIDSPEYYGTVAQDPSLTTSQLPVVHWFMEGNQNPDGNTRARIAIFHLDEFYDNVGANIHGQSTQGFGKKSYDLDFTGDQRFKWTTDPAARRAKDVNLLSNWADKAKVRNTMAYEICRLSGVAAHWAQPVRVQRNAQFFAVADMVEDGDDRYLERTGLDPDGALYKLYSPMQTNFSAEKKARKYEGTADLLALATGLNLTGDAYERFCYDNLDTPAMINFCAALTMTSNTDTGHKNYYCYRDSNASLLWRVLPWDLDLSFGHNWTYNAAGNAEGLPVQAAYFDDTIYYKNPVDIGGGNTMFRWGYYGDARTTEMYRRRLRTLVDTYLKPSGTDSWHHTRTNQLNAQIDPPNIVSDADLDFQRWGTWGNNDTMPVAIGRILTNNPGANVNYALPFIQGRRNHLYSTIFAQAGWPGSQPTHMPIAISSVIFNPGTTSSQNQEYIVLTNSNSIAVDVSNWKLEGAIDFTLPPGTVIPAMISGQPDRNNLYVVRNVQGFLTRTLSPKGNEKRFLAGGFPGQLSARGETLTLKDDTNFVIATSSFGPAPTPSQNFLRVSQILYAPLPPTPAELAVNPILTAADFEWIELVNTGAAPLVLDQAQFIEGIAYAFPNGVSLAAGAKLIVAANPAAFALRHPGVTVPVLGPYDGQLDNNGEQLHLVDTFGESVLEFSYNDAWYAPTNHDGYPLVILNAAATPYTEYGSRVRWGLGAVADGQPGAAVPTLGMCYDFWTNTPFTALERGDPLVSGEEIDNDNDGINNWTEYCLGSPPKSPSTGHLPTGGTVNIAGQNYTALTFRRQLNAVDVNYIVEVSPALDGAWTAVNTPVGLPVNNGDGTETLTVRDPQPQTTRQFIHLRLERK
jgi:hypothetical protein